MSYDFVNPDHYKYSDREIWEMQVAIWGPEAYITYCEINAFKYRMRMGKKPGQPHEQDLNKALWYERKAAELRAEISDNSLLDGEQRELLSGPERGIYANIKALK